METASLLFEHEITLGGLDQGSYFVADLTQSSYITFVNNNDDISPPPP